MNEEYRKTKGIEKMNSSRSRKQLPKLEECMRVFRFLEVGNSKFFNHFEPTTTTRDLDFDREIKAKF
uniref:Uncharacterized protein n=1 Tax=Romanomermis culicivorax TaxID=13658 RepID=A0A915I379_ROMCU